jgi:IQ and ubiquitin-like domain-containing protein
MASPKKWHLSTGATALVETPATSYASRLRDLYVELLSPPENVEQRLARLLDLKTAVKPYSTPTARDIIQLVNREGDLLCRNRCGPILEGLRVRISCLFHRFLVDSSSNPEAKKDPQISSSKPHIMKYCKSCLRHDLPLSSFADKSPNSLCKTCFNQRNIGSRRRYSDEYARILAAMVMRSESGPAHRMTESDIRQLVDVIWQKKSVLSGVGSSKLSELVFVEWDTNKPISPWNGILVTHAEAQVHNEKSYSNEFRTCVLNRLNLARLRFARLYREDEDT